MSNNLGPHAANGNRLPFVAAQYMDRTATIRRTGDYEETIASIKAAFPVLRSLSSTSIRIYAMFPEINEVEVTNNMWAELVPNLVQVRIGEGGCSSA